MTSNTVDILVVGCGVSGASTALAAVRSSASVMVLEEHPRVGYPSHCSGHIGIDAFNQFGPDLPSRIVENKIKGAILNAPNGKSLTISRANPVTWVLNRAEFDRYLASLAVRNGAALHLNSRVDYVQRSGKGFLANVNFRKHRMQISCKLLIDAGGCAAPASRYVAMPSLKGSLLVNSAQCNVDNVSDVDPDFVEVYYSQRYAPGFFGWLIPRRDGSAKVGLAAGARANVRICFERFLKKHPILKAKLKKAKIVTKPRYHPIPVNGARDRTYADGFMSVGDAASQVKPTTGGGIIFGLICGRIAGEIASKAIELGDLSASNLRSYENSWRSIIGFDLKAMASLRRLLYRLPDSYLDRIFELSNDLKVDEILSRTSDIDFQGRTLLALARDPRLFITLLCMSVISMPSLIRRNDSRFAEVFDSFS